MYGPNRQAALRLVCVSCAFRHGVSPVSASSPSSRCPSLAPKSRPPSNPRPPSPKQIDVVETSSTANRFETPTAEVGSSITVLDRADIERHQWSTVADALRAVPGLDVLRSGGAGQVTSVFMRGGSSSQVLVLLDGVRLNSATTGAFDFADLTTDTVERIEVVRGPQSTLYGSEATSGVISISTRRPPSESFDVSGRIEGGEDDHRRLELSAAGRLGAFDYRLSLADHHTDGVSAADARRGNPELDAWSNTTASAHFGWQLGDAGDAGRLDVDLRQTDSDVEVDGFAFPAGPVDDLDARNLREALTAGVTLQLTPTDRWTQTVHVGVSDDELRGEDPTNPFGEFVIDSETVQASTRTDLRFGEEGREQTLSLGADWESREGGSVGTFSDDVEIVSVYVQDHVSLGRLHLTLGARHDDHSQFGGETTWRAAFAFQASASGRLHGSWGTGFKAPTLNDLFFPGFGNPDLVPETSEGVDLGYEHHWGNRRGDRWSLDLTGFDLDFENLIAFDFDTFLPQNIAAASSRGVELQVAYQGEQSTWWRTTRGTRPKTRPPAPSWRGVPNTAPSSIWRGS